MSGILGMLLIVKQLALDCDETANPFSALQKTYFLSKFRTFKGGGCGGATKDTLITTSHFYSISK